MCLVFCMIFEEIYFSCYILLPDYIALSGCFISWYIVQMSVAIFCQGCDVINFEIINLFFLIKQFSLYEEKVKTKVYASWEPKEVWRRNKKRFSSFQRVFIEGNKTFFLEGKNATLIQSHMWHSFVTNKSINNTLL